MLLSVFIFVCFCECPIPMSECISYWNCCFWITLLLFISASAADTFTNFIAIINNDPLLVNKTNSMNTLWKIPMEQKETKISTKIDP